MDIFVHRCEGAGRLRHYLIWLNIKVLGIPLANLLVELVEDLFLNLLRG